MLTRRDLLKSGAGCIGLASACGVCGSLAGCSSRPDNQVIIYSCGEGERNEALMTQLRQDLPDLDIRMQYMSTGNLAARLAVQGPDAEFDIALMLEGGYLMAVEDSLVDLSERFPLDVFEDDLVISNAIMPFTRECGCFAYNTEVLSRAGIRPPEGFEDLLDKRFRGLISMPNPKASSTGYNFYYLMVHQLGEDAALSYFDELAQNVYQFTSSGSTPASALTQGEAGVGLSLIFQLVSERRAGSPIELCRFEEGVPWTMNGVSVVAGHDDRDAVWDVMRWFYERGILLDKERFVPDRVFKGQQTNVDGYPTNLAYADMDGLFDTELKEGLLARWKY